MGSILGGRQTSSQASTSSGQGTSKSVQGSKSSSTGISSSTAGMSAAEVLSNWSANRQGTDQWSKSAALNDVQGALRTQAQDALQSVMPNIAKIETGAGAYSSTTKDLLRNDANARITAQLSKTALDAITQYGQLGNQAVANNNQLLGDLGSVAKDTGSSQSTQISDSSSFGQSESQYDQESSSSGKGRGGSGLLGLFADGGEVGETNEGDGDKDDLLQTFLDASGINKNIMDFQDLMKAGGKLMDGDFKGAAKDAAQAAGKAEQQDMKLIEQGAKALAGFFADGGRVGGGDYPLMKERLLHRQDGGPVPEDTLTPAEELLAAVRKYNNGGKVRSGESDVQAGGRIRGTQSPTGEDNQVIGVAGGEGIIPKDVMEKPGVSQFLEHLIKTYHTPVASK